ncbi:cytochrome c oxidase subunit 3 [Spongiibacter taiwanensis]|uniref:cytochrome c oxidase subunit 3 n=1 Tax=Spongiibacter taiwanensis TaxID=1748242 RepID=UPI002034B9B8|nr:cytochrome c oxidase subunit 3 [Spongiibacter taiwanensis]USA44452.1 cytochrome c oxidase subunit 3 [Spongiibacter taiwanensis]
MSRLDCERASGERSSPGREIIAGVHFFILADIFVFAALFAGFMIERSQNVVLFNESANALNPWAGIINTLILVTSGMFVVFAVNAAKEGSVPRFRRWVLLSFIVGLGFAVSKLWEYGDKLSHGITMMTNDFYMFYYALTGAHFLHFVGGMAALAFVWVKAGMVGREPEMRTVESVALYWHMVDLLWIFIFPLLYLLGV